MVNPHDASEDVPESFFAPAGRAREEDLRRAVAVVSQNPVIDTVMRTFGGLVAVLNQERQILAVNVALLRMLGIEDAAQALGLRPGEALQCVYADTHPGGCGTTRYCSNCGAAISIVMASKEGVPEERECVLTVHHDGKTMDVDFAVRCCPIEMEGLRLLLLFMRDISEDKRRGALERTFFHDISNLLSSLSMAVDLLSPAGEQDDLAVARLRQSISLLVKEMEIQQALCRAEPGTCPFWPQETSLSQILDRLQEIYVMHPAAAGKGLRVSKSAADTRFATDAGLLLRALMNLVTNALEATPLGNEVRVWTEAAGGTVTFLVWNPRPIPPDVARRVFQRYFTTKPGTGRGIGTFATRWLTQRYLKGEVDFTSAAAEGTTFRLRIPERL